MASHPRTVTQRALLQLHLDQICDTSREFQHQFWVLRHRYLTLPTVVIESVLLSDEDRAMTALELTSNPFARFPDMVISLNCAVANISAGIQDWNLGDAEARILPTQADLDRAGEFLKRIKTAVEAHERVQKALELHHQLLLMHDILDGFTATHVGLRSRYRGLHPSVQRDSAVGEYAQNLVNNEFNSGTIARSPFSVDMESLSLFSRRCFRAVKDMDIENAQDMLNDAGRSVGGMGAYLDELQAAVDAYVEAQGDFKDRTQRFSAWLLSIAPGPPEGLTHPLPSLGSGKQTSLQVEQEEAAEEQLDRTPPKEEVSSFCNSVESPPPSTLIREEFQYAKSQPSPSLHHPRPVSLSPRAAVAKWMSDLPETAGEYAGPETTSPEIGRQTSVVTVGGLQEVRIPEEVSADALSVPWTEAVGQWTNGSGHAFAGDFR